MLEINIWPIFWTIFNIILLFILLRIFLFKPLDKIAQQRQAMIQEQIDSAEAKNKEAGELRDKYDASMQNAKAESDKIIADADARAKTKYDQTVEKANEDAAQIIKQARQTAEADRDQIMRDAQKELANVALDAAGKLLGSNVDSDANKKMLDDFLAEKRADK